MTSTPSIQITKQSPWAWLCSISSAASSLLLALLAVHGWILGKSATITESAGPVLFQLHLLVMGALMLFATWVAAPLWLALSLSRTFRQPLPTLIIQAIVFAAGWLLVFGAMLLVEASPAGSAF